VDAEPALTVEIFFSPGRSGNRGRPGKGRPMSSATDLISSASSSPLSPACSSSTISIP